MVHSEFWGAEKRAETREGANAVAGVHKDHESIHRSSHQSKGKLKAKMNNAKEPVLQGRDDMQLHKSEKPHTQDQLDAQAQELAVVQGHDDMQLSFGPSS